jgi:hypothetical protein
MRLKYGVAIAGSHGKTTTTSLAAHLLAHAGMDPTAVVGGKVNGFGSNAKLGKGDYMVVEADESDGSFLHIPPTIAVVTNVDPEHLDHWKTAEALREGFVAFVNRVPFYGLAILCIDHPGVQSLLPDVEKRFVTYGEAPQADWRARDIRCDGFRTSYVAWRRAEELGRVTICMPGRHNVLNSLAVLAVADFLGVPFAAALRKIEGVNLYLMPAGSPVKNPLELLNLRTAKTLFEELPRAFDWAIFDTPPLLFSADANLLATLADGTVLVVRARHTRRELFQHALESFHASNILGVVLNDVNLNKTRYAYAYRYYSKNYGAGITA